MWYWLAIGFLVGLPVISLACFVAGLAYKGACPSWLLAVAAIPSLIGSIAVVWWMFQGPPGLGILALLLLGASLIMLGRALWLRRSRKAVSASSTIVALALPLPVMAAFVALVVLLPD